MNIEFENKVNPSRVLDIMSKIASDKYGAEIKFTLKGNNEK